MASINIMDKKIHLVAYLDILGFKNHVKNYFNNEIEPPEQILDIIKKAFKEAPNLPYFKPFKEIGMEIQYKQFSDCTCLAVPQIFDKYSEANALILSGFIHLLEDFYFHMLTYKIVLRGGVSIGYHYEDENIIFSEGLINAYQLELEAVYPRIVIDEELVKIFKKQWEEQRDALSRFGIEKILVSDWEGSVFINPFKKAQSNEKLILKGNIEKPLYFDDGNDVIGNLSEIDKKAIMKIVKMLETEIKKIESDENGNRNVLKKYMWLKELALWNINPESAKIKFEYILK